MDPQQVRNRYNEMNSQVPRIEYLPGPHIDLNRSNRDQIRMRAFRKIPSPPRKLRATCSQGGPSGTSTQMKVPVESSRELAALQRPPDSGKEADSSYHTRDTQTDLSKWEKRPARPSPKGPSISASIRCNQGSHRLRKCGRHQDNKTQTDKCLVNPRKYHALLRYIECGGQDPDNRQPLYIMVPNNNNKLEQQNEPHVKLDQPMEVTEITPPLADLGPNMLHNTTLERSIMPSTSPREHTLMAPPSLKVSIPLKLIQPPTCWEKQFICASQPSIIWSPKVSFNTGKRTVKEQVELNRAIVAISDTESSTAGPANRLEEKAEKMRMRMMKEMRIELFGNKIELDKKQGGRDRNN